VPIVAVSEGCRGGNDVNLTIMFGIYHDKQDRWRGEMTHEIQKGEEGETRIEKKGGMRTDKQMITEWTVA
jgi:hypothetical protein